MNQVLISPSKVTVALSAAITASILLAMLLWFWIDVEPVRTPYLNIEDLPSAQMTSVRDVDAVLARPLFWQGREPVLASEETVAEVESQQASPLKNIKLLGIVLNGDVRTALLEVDGKVIPAQVGQAIQDWTVEKVTAKEVNFVAGTKQEVLTLVRERPDSIQLEKTK